MPAVLCSRRRCFEAPVCWKRPCQNPTLPIGSRRSCAAVAQLVRAPDCGSGGRWFNSPQLYQHKINNLAQSRAPPTGSKNHTGKSHGWPLTGCPAPRSRSPLAPDATQRPSPRYSPRMPHSDCSMINAEIQANNKRAEELASEQNAKVVQNVAAGVVGIVVWPVWFAMDAKGAASTDAAALKGPPRVFGELGCTAVRGRASVRGPAAEVIPARPISRLPRPLIELLARAQWSSASERRGLRSAGSLVLVPKRL
jgi:hypothetical protein